jgi:HAD superfamily hydrolase (TIGR01509 family)
MRFEAIIFDFDGVIVDSEIVYNAALASVLTDLGHPVSVDEAVRLYSGRRWSDCHARIEAECGRAFESEWLAQFVDDAVAARAGEVVAIEGVHGFLAAQSDRALAIASSSDEGWLQGFLARLGLAASFNGHVYSAAHLPLGKPNPDVYLMAASRIGFAPSACLVIEDHPVGAAAGAAAGATVIGLTAASHIRDGHADALRAAGARYVAHDYSEVAGIIARLES